MNKAMMQSLAGGMLLASAVGMGGRAMGQVSILVADRTADRIWLARDVNNDGLITDGEPAELHAYFDGLNAASTSAPLSPNALGYRDGFAFIGDNDSANRKWMWAMDINDDGDALDAGESGTWCEAGNPGGFSFAFPTGVAFDLEGRVVLVNAGNGFGADDVFLTADTTGDVDGQDEGETTRWVTANGFGVNGTFSPQEVCYDHRGILYLRNSGAANGVYRLEELDGSGLIDTAEEMTLFFGPGNQSGITLSTGFSISLDPVRSRAFYLWQTVTGGVDQLLRIRDVNGDGDAQDEGEGVLVYATSESGFTSIDELPLADGSVLISENSGNKVYRLVDLDGDGLFSSTGERVDFIAAGLSAARCMALVHDVGCSAADIGRQGGVLGGDGVLDNNDFVVYIDLFFGEAPLADVGRQGGVAPGDGTLDNNDFVVFIDSFFAGCP